MKKIITLFVFSLCFVPFLVHAQFRSNISDTIVNAKLISFNYSYEYPFADLANRFGSNYEVGGSFYFKLSHNLLLGVDGEYFAGQKVKEDTILNNLLTSQGYLFGFNGAYDNVLLTERGYSFWGKAGIIVPVFNSNPNSGITFLLGAGFMQHKIKITDVENEVTEIDGDYVKGYDRLTNGFAISQYLGFMHLDKHRLVNFSIGIEAKEGFTQNRRSWNFDQMKQDDTRRLDGLIGLKASWMLPFYGRGEERMYTY